MITQFKIYENNNDPFIKIDDFFLVNTYRSMGPSDKQDGQIYLKTRATINNNWTRTTLIAGVAKLLGTEYENNAKLREIKIPNTMSTV